ncbi:MAG: cyclophilin-like fold protein [Ruminococcus sp.]|nr:cyclophilin-like fold protein [Ruminococcus sp.]
MRKTTAILIILAMALTLFGCQSQQSSTSNPTAVSDKATSDSSAAEFDPYATENRYDIGDEMFKKRGGVDYGTVHKDVSYYSTTAGDNKQCNVLLPSGFNENEKYPVMYVFHGFGGSHSNQIDKDSYLTLLYGNMLHDGLTVPMIIVNVDMYTDKQADKESYSEEQLRYSYDKAIDDVAVDLMPFIEKTYPIKTGRENTAIAGMSEGGAKSLCTGFKWLDKIGYTAGFAPDTNVIAIGENYMDSFWTVPYFKEGFPQPTEENMPYYLYMAVGSKDPWNIEGTLYYRDVLNDMGVKNQTDSVEGYGHDFKFWRQCFYNYLTKVFRCVRQQNDASSAKANSGQLLKIEINGSTFYADFEDNPSAEALKEKLHEGSLTLEMEDYGGFEKVGELPFSLPADDENITTSAGDVILYQGNKLTIYYDTNTWSFTKVAKLRDADSSLKSKLGEGTVKATFSIIEE